MILFYSIINLLYNQSLTIWVWGLFIPHWAPWLSLGGLRILLLSLKRPCCCLSMIYNCLIF